MMVLVMMLTMMTGDDGASADGDYDEGDAAAADEDG
jgi:hypothetical protein